MMEGRRGGALSEAELGVYQDVAVLDRLADRLQRPLHHSI